jgi:nitrite reductase/ring-hydroxylating ferredoxin subunit
LPSGVVDDTVARRVLGDQDRVSATGEQTSVVVCAADALEPGGMAAARIGMLPVVVLRTFDGELHAFVDRCLHQGARLSGGRVLPHTEGDALGEYRMLDAREVVKCPWHGYEYDVRTGCAVFDRRRALGRLAVSVEDGQIVITRTNRSRS